MNNKATISDRSADAAQADCRESNVFNGMGGGQQIEVPIEAYSEQIGHLHRVVLFPPVKMPDGRPEKVFLAVYFEFQDGKLTNFTTDSAEWNRLVETREKELIEQSAHKCTK